MGISWIPVFNGKLSKDKRLLLLRACGDANNPHVRISNFKALQHVRFLRPHTLRRNIYSADYFLVIVHFFKSKISIRN